MDPSSVAPRSAAAAASAAGDDADAVALQPPGDTSSPISTVHLARFEFSDHGTKVLMVEWQPGGATSEPGPGADSTTPAPPPALASESSPAAAGPPADTAGWEVSWPGKSTLVPARDAEQDSARRRVYFLLPPQAPVPATITISQPGGASLEVKPLPAIFPEGFNVESGPHGVLHTIWAKKRVSELQREIDAEMRANAESIGVEIAVAEKQFIIDTFLSPPAPPTSPDSAPLPPRSPIGGRLGDKLKGLRLATSPADLVPTANTFTGKDGPAFTLSPQGGDIAVASFSALPGRQGVPVSLDAALQGDVPRTQNPLDTEDGLFALPMSPRSPDMKKSPFSTL